MYVWSVDDVSYSTKDDATGSTIQHISGTEQQHVAYTSYLERHEGVFLLSEQQTRMLWLVSCAVDGSQ